MPDFLPDRLEAGTLNVPGIAGLSEGLKYLLKNGTDSVFQVEHRQVKNCIRCLQKMGVMVFSGEHQSGTVSFVPNIDCEIFAEKLSARKIAVRAGLHCAPTAHESAGTLETGTVRVSFGHDASDAQSSVFLRAVSTL
jgi:selenocysteine lyase/cysteine desulfurase